MFVVKLIDTTFKSVSFVTTEGTTKKIEAAARMTSAEAAAMAEFYNTKDQKFAASVVAA